MYVLYKYSVLNTLYSLYTSVTMRVKPKWVGREPEFLKLDSETSQADPPVLYDNFRPLAILSKIGMVLPVKNIFTNGGSLDFKWFSLEIISVPLLNLSIGYFLASKIIYDDGFKPIMWKKAGVCLVSNLWFMYGQHHLLTLVEKINQFDNCMLSVSKAVYYKRLSRFTWVIGSFAYPILLLLKVGTAEYYGEPCTKYKCAPMEIIKGVFHYQHQLQLFIYTFFCYELKHRYKTLNVVFYDFIKTSYLGRKVVGDNHVDFENHRLQYIHLVQCTKTLNDLYGVRFAFILGGIILEVIRLLYFFYTEKGYIITGYDVMSIVYNFILLFFVTLNTDLLVVESQKMESYLNFIPTQELSWNTQFQLDHTLHQCEMFQVNISACGMVDVDRSLLLSMAGAIAMYFIAILQMTTTIGSFSW